MTEAYELAAEARALAARMLHTPCIDQAELIDQLATVLDALLTLLAQEGV